MSILIVYSNYTRKFVDYCVDMLTEAGYTVQSMDKDQAASEYNLEIRLLPSFYIVKAGIPAYPMYGIQNMDTILNWAKSANI